MTVIDVDSHFHEPMDWLEVTDPGLAAELAPPIRFMDFMRAASTMALPMLAEEDRPADPAELYPESFRTLMQRLDELQPAELDLHGDDPTYLADARLAVMDRVGIDVQFLNFTFASSAVLRAAQAGRTDLLPRIQSAYNTFVAGLVAGHTDRLVPVCRMHIEDVEWCVAEITRMRELGSRAFQITQNPTKSLTHPDYEPLWSAAEDLGMLAYVHVFFGRPGPHPSWANNGRGVAAFTDGVAAGDQRAETMNLLNALVFDGVLERHPDLRVVVAESGHSWVPPMAHEFDRRVRGVGVDGRAEASFYELPLRPSEYLARQVKVSPLPGFVETGHEYLALDEAFERFPEPRHARVLERLPPPRGSPRGAGAVRRPTAGGPRAAGALLRRSDGGDPWQLTDPTTATTC
jgi:predicted TIM-barrel fold metal-dependent hydrolase